MTDETDEYEEERAIRKISVVFLNLLAIMGEDNSDAALAEEMTLLEQARLLELGAIRAGTDGSLDIDRLIKAAMLVSEVIMEKSSNAREELLALARDQLTDD